MKIKKIIFNNLIMNLTPSKWIYLLIGALIFFLIYLIVTTSPNTTLTKSLTNSNDEIKSNDSTEKDDIIKELSRLLNQASNQVGKLSCQLNGDDVSTNGGWCSKISGKNSSQHMTDVPLAKALSSFLKGKKVASFGDGPGIKTYIFKKRFRKIPEYPAFKTSLDLEKQYMDRSLYG